MREKGNYHELRTSLKLMPWFTLYFFLADANYVPNKQFFEKDLYNYSKKLINIILVKKGLVLVAFQEQG